MNANLAASSQRSRDSIMAQLATVLRNSNERTTNIESVIAKANVSPQEIAAKFGGNRELILAMVSQLSDSMSAPLTIGAAKSDLQQRLLEFGRRVAETYGRSHLHSLYRIAITESIRHTGLGRDFYDAGPGRLTQRLAEFLQSAQAEGAFGSADPHLLASHFLSSLRANLEGDDLAHGLATNAAAERTYVQNVVDLFFHGIDGGNDRAESKTIAPRVRH